MMQGLGDYCVNRRPDVTVSYATIPFSITIGFLSAANLQAMITQPSTF
jgi:hypothetical protein